jgi:hypothetical protein
MKILHITPASIGYEEVELIANHYSRKNSLAIIERFNGELNMTGGFLIDDTPEIRRVLDMIPVKDQYEFVKSFKMDPFAKLYYTED